MAVKICWDVWTLRTVLCSILNVMKEEDPENGLCVWQIPVWCMESHSSLNLDCQAILPFYSQHSQLLLSALVRITCTVNLQSKLACKVSEAEPQHKCALCIDGSFQPLDHCKLLLTL